MKLLATFRLKKLAPPPQGLQYAGSFSIANIIPSTLYGGAWHDGVNWFQLEFTYPAPPGGDRPRANWWLGPDPDMGIFQRHDLQLPPPMAYKSGSPDATVDQWVGQLLVTS